MSDKTLRVVSVETTDVANPRTGERIIHISDGGRDTDPTATVHHGLILVAGI